MTAPIAAGVRTENAGETKRDHKLEGLRGYLALGVVVYHVAFYAGLTSFLDLPTHGIWTVLVDGLSVCLAPFFVLSAFFLYRPFARAVLAGTKHPPARPFWWRRFLRLIPAYWVVVTFALLVFDINKIDGFWYAARPYLLMHFYWPNAPWITGLVPTWTVPAEMLFYLILPGIAVLIGRYARKAATLEAKRRRMLAPLTLFAVIGFAWTVYTNIPSQLDTAVVYNLWYWPFGYYDAFAIGMLLATVSAYHQVSGKTPRSYAFVAKHPNVLWALALVVFVVNLNRFFGKLGMGDWASFNQELLIHALVLLFAGLIVAPLTVPGVRSRLMEITLNPRPIRFVGRISYGVYLWHMVVVSLLLKQGPLFGNTPGFGPELYGAANFWWLLTWTTVGTIAVSAVSYYLLEQPLSKLGRRKPDPAPPAAEPAVKTGQAVEVPAAP
ncbi:acyltransferase [Dactylosporangium sp. NPDC050588]|uniref:acyltransferase family protein n=1 Tax=Dactylosporangium sp. NPDC050588 TaxID=3157211 RepID=UPI003405520A